MADQQQCRWHYTHIDELAAQRAHALLVQAEQAIAQRGNFHLVLAGGQTPRSLYQRLASMNSDWHRWWIYFGDERCLPVGDPDRNDTMAERAWLSRVPIPTRQIASIPAELGPTAGAAQYSDHLRSLDTFDLVLLGLGEDGHTASLFPGLAQPAADDPPALPVHAAPKPPPQRITLSAGRLSRARQVWFLVSGESKRTALERWQRHEEGLPATWIRPRAGVDIYTDVVLDMTT